MGRTTEVVMTESTVSIPGTPYLLDDRAKQTLEETARRVKDLRSAGKLTADALRHIRRSFRVKSIYHSNAIEGNRLSIGETRQVVELGLTLTGQSLKDQAEAKNLAAALDYLEDLASHNDKGITESDIRQIHAFVLKGIDDENAGRYRQVPVEISGSDYKPTGPESVPAEMEQFGNWLSANSVPGDSYACTEGIVTAVAAHAWFVMIHPFIDGNGRVARLLMNLILMRHGFPIAIITRDDRLRYYDALEESQAADLTPFVGLVSECVAESLEYWEEAARESKEAIDFAKTIAERLESQPLAKASGEYEVWRSAMDLLRGYFTQMVESITRVGGMYRVFFKDFGHLDFEKFVALKQGHSVKRTWYFRLDFRVEDRAARYLFFFGFPSRELREKASVTLWLSREAEDRKFFYEALERITAPNVPDVCEIGYNVESEKFLVRGRNGRVTKMKVEAIAQKLIDAVVRCHFDRKP
jgi:Fic family protein